MGERLFSELSTNSERRRAATQAGEWGFPRPITDDELEFGAWYALGNDILFWFERIPGTTDLGLHIAVAPLSQKRWPVRRWHAVMCALAEILGARALHCIPLPGDDKVPNYLERLGWSGDESLLTLSLGA